MTFFVEVVKKESAEVLHIGEFESLDEAVACAKRAIDTFLLREHQVGMTSDRLFTSYAERGEYPCIFRDGDTTLNVPGFNHLQYSMDRCQEICGKKDPWDHPGTSMDEHEGYMSMALEAARAAGRAGNRPIASIIVRDGEILGTGSNTMFSDFDPSAHAEIAAVRDACARLKSLDLSGSTLYSTIEPCPMCFWAMQEAKVARLVLGGRYAGLGRTDLGRYSVESFMEFTGRRFELVTGVMQTECEDVRMGKR
jgi:tRNA(Arg) A34 adenosine deaminase TadA